MVILVKPITGSNDIQCICKYMINIEQNKNIFDEQGQENKTPLCDTPFNNYTHQRVDYDMTVSFGVILCYVDDDIHSIRDSIQQNIRRLSFTIPNEYYPIHTSFSKSTTYTMINKKASFDSITTTSRYGRSYRKIIIDENGIKTACETGSRFVWFVHKVTNFPYLKIPELSLPSHPIYLLRSISTIIYDKLNLFNMEHGTKQLDYPKLSQYNMFKLGKISSECIKISNIFGLDYEIIQSYYDYDIKFNYDMKLTNTHKKVNYTKFKIRRLNPKIKWHNQLCEQFDYEKQETLEEQNSETGKPLFRNDVCFVSGIPLYNNVYLLKVASINNDGVVKSSKSYIMVNSFVYHMTHIINDKPHTFTDYLAHYKIKILKIYISSYKRTDIDVIKTISNNKISQLKKKIMISIITNGVCIDTHLNKCYTADIDDKVVYIGKDSITDLDIIIYHKTDTIIFQYQYI